MSRKLTLADAQSRYVHRFTMEHKPAWANSRPCDNGGTETRYYAPQYRSDAEWYANTIFPGEGPEAGRDHCFSTSQTWPLGQWLDKPYSR